MKDTLCIVTKDKLEDILAANNSAAWYLQPRRAREMTYLVCAALDRDHPDLNRKPFLVAKITDVVRDEAASSVRNRFAICFSEYALIDTAAQKPLSGSQNPVRWAALSETIVGDPATLTWLAAPSKTIDFSYSRREPRVLTSRGLSVSEAKAGLAERFGVPESAIEIIIRA